MQSDYSEKRYKLNRNTTAIVKSKKSKDSNIYTNTVTITHETAALEPLEFEDRKELQSTIAAIDLEDDQLDLGV